MVLRGLGEVEGARSVEDNLGDVVEARGGQWSVDDAAMRGVAGEERDVVAAGCGGVDAAHRAALCRVKVPAAVVGDVRKAREARQRSNAVEIARGAEVTRHQRERTTQRRSVRRGDVGRGDVGGGDVGRGDVDGGDIGPSVHHGVGSDVMGADLGAGRIGRHRVGAGRGIRASDREARGANEEQRRDVGFANHRREKTSTSEYGGARYQRVGERLASLRQAGRSRRRSRGRRSRDGATHRRAARRWVSAEGAVDVRATVVFSRGWVESGAPSGPPLRVRLSAVHRWPTQ